MVIPHCVAGILYYTLATIVSMANFVNYGMSYLLEKSLSKLSVLVEL